MRRWSSLKRSDLRVFEGESGPQVLEGILGALNNGWRDHGNVPETVQEKMSTAASEVGTNIVEHSGRQVWVRMELRLQDHQVTVSFTDDGPAVDVDLDAVRMPDPWAERGRGLALVKMLTREFTYRRDGDGNHWTLVSEYFD